MNQHKPIAPQSAIKLYGASISGHSHRVELMMSLLGLPYELIKIDLPGKAQKTEAFLQMNPFGQIPVIKDGEITLADSNAILVYLSQTYAPSEWLPHTPVDAANVQRWLTVAAGLLAFGPAAARAGILFNRPFNEQEVMSRTNALFTVMDSTLRTSLYLCGNSLTIADIANYSYTARASEGRISLEPYPFIQAWLTRIEGLQGFVPMMKSNV
jgi:glutathione S-transferase